MSFRFGETDSIIQFVPGIELSRFDSDSGMIFVFDRNTVELPSAGGLPLRKQLAPGRSGGAATVILRPGERSKNWAGARKIMDKALEAGLGRDGLIAGIGGGMVCDLAAFAASLFMRGCRLNLVPTSLLGMVDAAIGGKTAVNYGGYKNIAGTYYPAERILLAVSFLGALPEREFRSGMGEMIKTALLGDETLLELLAREKERIWARDPLLMAETVRRCITVKGRIVAEDLREGGNRAFLNLGHTFAHAVEAVTRYRLWSHGQAVAWGVMQAAVLSERLGLADAGYTKLVSELIRMYGFDLRLPARAESILEAMRVDKKRRRRQLRLVLQRGIGDTVVRAVEPRLVAETLNSVAGNFA
jgi:3-dehydroquinate synthase